MIYAITFPETTIDFNVKKYVKRVYREYEPFHSIYFHSNLKSLKMKDHPYETICYSSKSSTLNQDFPNYWVLKAIESLILIMKNS